MPILRRRQRPSLLQGLSSLSLVAGGLFGLFHLPPLALVWAVSIWNGVTLAPGQAWAGRTTIEITDDRGGPVVQRLASALALERAGVRVEVVGVCASACTYHLPSPGTCTTPDALWMFHPIGFPEGRSSPFTWLGQNDQMQQRLTDAALDRFPAALETWQRSIPQGQERWVTGNALIQAGWVQPCTRPALRSVAWAETQAARLSVPPVPVWDLPNVRGQQQVGYSPSPPSP
jgi:hypothetical protein